jgi:hypothetical protein
MEIITNGGGVLKAYSLNQNNETTTNNTTKNGDKFHILKTKTNIEIF